MGMGDLDMAVDDHGIALEAHGAHADLVAELLQLGFERRHLRVRVAVADGTQTGRLFADAHAGILVAAETDADNRRLAGEAAAAELDHDVEEKALDAVDAVGREQHPVVGAEEAALMHGNQVDPVAVGLERVFDLRRVDADIVVVIGPAQGMHPIGPERDLTGRLGDGLADGPFQGDKSAFDKGFIASLDKEPGQAGIGAHGPAILAGGAPIFHHRLQHEDQ